MFRFLKDLFSKSEEEKEMTFSVDTVGPWLDEREEDVATGLREAVERCRAAVSSSLEDLGRLLATLKEAEGREDIHPKLKSVTERSLPAFVTVMEQQASRPLPDDPDDFYAAAADLLNGFLKAQKGQGRYLSSVFPEEMKEIRGITRAIGREVNTLTDVMKEAREEEARIDAARTGLAAIEDAKTEAARLDAEIGTLKERQEASGRAIAEAEEKLGVLRANADYIACTKEQEGLAGLQREEKEVGQDLTNSAAKAARVIRKAERIAGRAEAREDLRTLRACTAFLDRPLAADPEEMLPLLTVSAGIVRRQIEGGDLVLKGKDDLALFAEESTVVKEMEGRMAALAGVRERVAAAEERVRACTAYGEVHDLEEKIASTKAQEETDRQAIASAEERKKALADGEADRMHRLEEALGAAAGQPVTLSGDTRSGENR